MAITKEQVAELYIALFGRAPDGEGLYYWLDMANAKGWDIETLADNMFYAASQQFPEYGNVRTVIESAYQNVLGKSPEEDPEGIDYWVQEVLNGKLTVGQAVAAIIYVAKTEYPDHPATKVLENRTEAGVYIADKYRDPDINKDGKVDSKDIEAFQELIQVVTDDPTTIDYVKAIADSQGLVKATLTAEPDNVTANIIEAPMVYNPGGTDYIPSLQDEDVINGIAGLDNNTLNVTLGNQNPNEGTSQTVTPTINNVQTINIEWTGNTNTLDLRYSDGSAKEINITKVTADTGDFVNVQNISSPVANLSIANASSERTTATFNYKSEILDSTGTLNLAVSDSLLNGISQTSVDNEGFKVLDLNVTGPVDLNFLSITKMEEVYVSGEGSLKIVNTQNVNNEYEQLLAGGLQSPFSPIGGISKIDLTNFQGNTEIDISSAVGKLIGPANSGTPVQGTVIGNASDNIFWARTQIVSGTTIDGGDGQDNLIITTGGVAAGANISNLETLELRTQGATNISVDFSSFDDKLTQVIMRDETPDGQATTFTLNNLTAALAENALVLKHSVTENPDNLPENVLTPNVFVNAYLADATGTNDTIKITVENDLNKDKVFNYSLDLDGVGGAGAVENVTIVDNDTESNSICLTAVDTNGNSEHTGTVTLTGGEAGDYFKVNTSLIASTIDASGQNSDLILTVGRVSDTNAISQNIKLGTGNDVLIFKNIDDFNVGDTITDAGGTDAVMAAFTKDATVSLTDIEEFYVIADNTLTITTDSTTLDKLYLMSNTAVDNSGDTYSKANLANVNEVDFSPIVNKVSTDDLITLKSNSKVSEINFVGDLDIDNDIGVESPNQVFNGIVLDGNVAETLTVNIGSALDNNGFNYSSNKL